MTVVFGAGNQVSFNLYADCPGDDWERIGQTERGRASYLAARVRAAVQRYGTVADVKAEAAPKTGGDSVLSARVVGFTATAEVSSDTLDVELLRELNNGLEPRAWLRHVPGTRNAALAAGAVVLMPVTVLAGVVGAVSSDAREWASDEYRSRLGFVIDTSSLVRGEQRSAPAASSIVGRVAGVAAGGAVSSTDPERDNRTPAESVASGVSWQPPAWLVVGGVVLGGLLAAVGIGYGARGIAQLVRETK